MPGVLPLPVDATASSLEEIDFFEVGENRSRIFQREGERCFYCLRRITSENFVIEHVASRPIGDNSYRNVVAACLQCNNRKGRSGAEDFLRTLYREALLSADDFEDRICHLESLRKGELKPPAF
jgi:5-methylcytosine-specific restriction endonuclease McrA